MAKKTKRPKQAAPRRKPSPQPRPASVPPPQDGGVASPSDGSVAVSSAPATAETTAPTRRPTAGPRRGVERLGQPQPRPVGRQRGVEQGWDLSEADAAIPFERVPYVPSDLKRVAVMAVVMVILIIVANVVVSRLVT